MKRKEDTTVGLSEEELQREADEIRALIASDPEVREMRVTEDMHNRMMDRLQKHEEEKAISGLSEKDREAWRLGKELQKRKEKGYRKKKKKVWMVLAATLVLVLGISITGVSGKNIIVELFEKTFGDGDKTYVDSGESETVGKVTEEEAYAEIKEVFGTGVARPFYLPENTEFLDIQLNSELQEAVLYYSVGEQIMSFQIVSRYVNSSTGMDIQDKLLQEYEIELPKTVIQVSEYQIPETGELEYTAQFSYKNCKYFLAGIVKQEEFEKILKNLHFF